MSVKTARAYITQVIGPIVDIYFEEGGYALPEIHDALEIIKPSAKNIIVEQNAKNPNRVDVLWPGTLINQLRVFALLNQFRTRAESTGA